MNRASEPGPKPRRRATWLGRLALMAIGSALALAVVEGGARALAWQRQRDTVADWQRLARGDQPREVVLPDTETTLGRLVRSSTDPWIVYEFLPGLRARFRGQHCAINAQGFRGPDWPPQQRTHDSVRIAGLGDSVMFGWAIAEDDTFLRALDRDLAAALPDQRIEVLNTGVPGYNTAMEVCVFEHKVLPWHPDIVLIDYVGNDCDLPNLIATQSSPFALDHSFAYDLAKKVLGRRSSFGDPLQTAPWSGSGFESDPARVPLAYRDMVGQQGVERALRRLHELSQQHDFHVVVTCHYEAPPFVHDVCARLGWAIVENVANVRRHLRAQGKEERDYLQSDMVVGGGDPHPSALAHRLFGAAIAEHLLATGWLQPARSRSQPADSADRARPVAVRSINPR